MRYEGRIFRPPGEWKSYLLQCTIGCSNNSCTFCGMYKEKQFRVRPLKDILEDIDMAKRRYGNSVKRVFLCDGDAIIMKQEELLAILEKLYASFPALEKVTTYAGPRSTLAKTPEQLRQLRQAGLARAYLGMETGWNDLLAKVKKGVNAQQMLEAGVKLREAGFDLWVMVILGLAGKGEASRTHALESAKMVNEMKPRHLSALTYMPDEGSEMCEDVKAGRFQMLSPFEIMEETRVLLENITAGPIHFTCDHASNYLSLKGTIPEETPKFLSMIDGALEGSVRLRKEEWRGL